jgi:hypothetical protein
MPVSDFFLHSVKKEVTDMPTLQLNGRFRPSVMLPSCFLTQCDARYVGMFMHNTRRPPLQLSLIIMPVCPRYQ